MSRAAAAGTRKEFIETDTGNKIYRRSQLEGKTHIKLGGRCVIMPNVTLRGDLHRLPSSKQNDKDELVAINAGRYVVIATGSVFQPPSRITKGELSYYTMRIGDNVFVGPDCIISSASISSYVHIGAGCILMPFCIIASNCHILPETVIPAGMVIPQGSRVGGSPARILEQVGEGWGTLSGDPDEVWTPGGDLRGLYRTFK